MTNRGRRKNEKKSGEGGRGSEDRLDQSAGVRMEGGKLREVRSASM
jgi:hypothetical protein